MSYLELPRLHFSGRFQADTSTVNNDVRHYDSDKFNPSFQEPMKAKDEKILKWNGYWNPQGTGAWRMLGCKITGAALGDEFYTDPRKDAAVGLTLGDAVDRVAGKLVDLDPQQQLVSQIWGLEIRLQDNHGKPALTSDFLVAPFCDLWLRQQNADHWLDQQLAAVYQSTLIGIKWGDIHDSPTLQALKAKSASGMLSIRMNVFGFDRTPGVNDFGTGMVVGTIGPAVADEPRRFSLGRQLTAQLLKDKNAYPFVPTNKIGNIQAQVNHAKTHLTMDFGNALPITDSIGTLEDIGPILVGVLKDGSLEQNQTIKNDQIELLGELDYRCDHWYQRTAGIVDFKLSSAAKKLIDDHPIGVVSPDGDDFKIINRETQDGLFVRADMFVYRLNPGETAGIRFYATKYGKPCAMTVKAQQTNGMMGGAGTGAKLPHIKIPDINTPEGIVTYPKTFQTNDDGLAVLKVKAAECGPDNPREYIDGQLYGIGYGPEDPPKNLVLGPFNYISLLAWDAYEIPEKPTWTEHIQPILTQYGNLYPIMSKRLVDLTKYESVVAHCKIIQMSFSLPQQNPNFMPVTRDLSANKLATVLKWLESEDPATGLPPYGPVADTKRTPLATSNAEAEQEDDSADLGSKVSFTRNALKQQQS